MYDREYFEEARGSNYCGYPDLPVFQERAQALSELAPLSVLDIGCAKGYLVKHLRSLGIPAWGADVSDYCVRTSDPEVRPYLVLTDVTRGGLPWSNQYFDLVVSYDVLEHIPEQELDRAVEEILRVGRRQLHYITCEEYQIGHDDTHVTIKPLVWWREKYPLLNPQMST